MSMKNTLFLLLFTPLFAWSSLLQEAINNAPAGSKIELQSGEYHGNIVINKPLTLDGLNQKAHIVGEGNGSVITITSSNVVIKNLTIKETGNSHSQTDSAIVARDVNNITVENNYIKESLFGINFERVNRSKILDNYITSKPVDLGMRGDAIKLWYAHDNQIIGNTIEKSRDFVLWYSSGNTIENNVGRHNRYSVHFMYAGRNMVKNNLFEFNSVGIFFMFSSGTTAINNTIRNSVGSFGVGIGMKDSSDFKLINNDIVYNARGLYIDQSPFQPGTINTYEGNKILYNTSGVQFQVSREKSIFTHNLLKGNMEQVINDSPNNNLKLNTWNENYWDTYEGFDQDKNNIGDIPFKHYVYADKLWLYNPNIKFFYGSVVMDLLNFLSKIAPFSEPDLLATDNNPLMEWNFGNK
jgi:nitrous oxidase accessory protein